MRTVHGWARPGRRRDRPDAADRPALVARLSSVTWGSAPGWRPVIVIVSYLLGRNHGNTPEIARLAEHFHTGRLPAAAVVRSSLKELPRLVRSDGLHSTAGLISNWCNTRGGSIGVIVNRNDTGKGLHGDLSRRLPQKRIDIYSNKAQNEDSIEMLEPGVTILNKESVKGQEFDAVFILELEEFIPCTTDVKRRAMYMMCTRARDHLFLVHERLSARAATALPDASVLERA